MDNFIDKLAQKFIAGEVIRANTQAEEKELKRLREQVAEYERCLQEMRKVQMTNTQTAQNLHDLMVESTQNFRKLVEENSVKVQEITTQGIEALGKHTNESMENLKKYTQESMETYQKHKEECADTLQEITKQSIGKIADIQLESDVQKAEAKKAVEAATVTMEQMQEKALKMQEAVKELTAVMEKNQKEVDEWFKQADDFLHKENVKVYRNVQAVIVDETEKKAEVVIKAQEDSTKKITKPVLIFAAVGAVAAVANLVVQILELTGVLYY